MKLKNRDWTEGERRLGAADSQLLQDKRLRAGMLAITILGMAVLACMAVYLVCLSPLQDSDPGASIMRSWRSVP